MRQTSSLFIRAAPAVCKSQQVSQPTCLLQLCGPSGKSYLVIWSLTKLLSPSSFCRLQRLNVQTSVSEYIWYNGVYVLEFIVPELKQQGSFTPKRCSKASQDATSIPVCSVRLHFHPEAPQPRSGA